MQIYTILPRCEWKLNEKYAKSDRRSRNNKYIRVRAIQNQMNCLLTKDRPRDDFIFSSIHFFFCLMSCCFGIPTKSIVHLFFLGRIVTAWHFWNESEFRTEKNYGQKWFFAWNTSHRCLCLVRLKNDPIQRTRTDEEAENCCRFFGHDICHYF